MMPLVLLVRLVPLVVVLLLPTLPLLLLLPLLLSALHCSTWASIRAWEKNNYHYRG